MMKTIKLFMMMSLFTIAASSFLTSCEKDDDKHTPPKIAFKMTSGYTFSDVTLGKDSTIKIGITADKTEDELSRLNVSYAYDGASSTTTKDNFDMSSSEQDHYEKDYTITTRSQAGAEKWVFTMTDKDGNIASVTLNLTIK